jgi:hypothetical protein
MAKSTSGLTYIGFVFAMVGFVTMFTTQTPVGITMATLGIVFIVVGMAQKK